MASRKQVVTAAPPPVSTPSLSIPSIISPLPAVPDIQDDDSFGEVARKLSFYFVEAINSPLTFDKLRKSPNIEVLQPLINALSRNVHHPAVVSVLLALKGHFAAIESEDDRGVSQARGFACEVVAWQFVVNLSEREAIDYLLWELPPRDGDPDEPREDPEAQTGPVLSNGTLANAKTSNGTPSSVKPLTGKAPVSKPSLAKPLVGKPTTGPTFGKPSVGKQSKSPSDETTPLLPKSAESASNHKVASTTVHFGTDHLSGSESTYFGTDRVLGARDDLTDADEFEAQFEALNALEIAAVSAAKKFLMQKVVQDILNAIWHGNIVFWDTLSIHSVKQAKIYNKNKCDPYCRLRVPRYIKAFEVAFFMVFLALYYTVLIERHFDRITPSEIALYIFIASFAYDEFSEFCDAGEMFYITDFWSWWDLSIIIIGVAFAVCRIIGLHRDSYHLLKIAFDILSLEAIFLVPRIFSMLSLHPYFGTLIPCLKEMAKQFIKFMSLVVLAYFGFLTTFTLLARGNLSLKDVAWISMKVFFGAAVVGIDASKDISPYLGLPVMLVFVCMTNILLITTMASFIGNSLTKVLDSSREEYLYVYSVYVLEASTSNRLTYFLPPLNLLPLLLLRPLRLIVPAEKLRAARILLLKVTHAPYVAVIWMYENGQQYMSQTRSGGRSFISSIGGPATAHPAKSPAKPRSFKSSLNSARPLAFAPAARAQASFEGSPRTGKTPASRINGRRTTAVSSEAGDQAKLVLELSAQIEQLKAQIARQQGQGQAQ